MPALELFVLDTINAVRFVFYFKKVLSISDFFPANILLRSTDGERSLKLNTEDPVDTQAIQSSICANFPPFSVHYQMPNLQSTIIYLNIFIALLWHLYNVSCLAQIHSGSIILNYFMFFFFDVSVRKILFLTSNAFIAFIQMICSEFSKTFRNGCFVWRRITLIKPVFYNSSIPQKLWIINTRTSFLFFLNTKICVTHNTIYEVRSKNNGNDLRMCSLTLMA